MSQEFESDFDEIGCTCSGKKYKVDFRSSFIEALSLIDCKLCNESFKQTHKPEVYFPRNGITYALHGVYQL